MRVILVLLLVCQLVLAQNEIATTGRQYDPGTRISFPSYGISFIIPRDWSGGLVAEEDIFFMASDGKPGVGLAILRPASSQGELEKYLNSVQNLGDNIILQPDGKIQVTGSDLSQNYSSSLYRGKAIVKKGLQGHDVIFFFAGPASQEKYYRSVVEKTASTATFTNPDPSQVIKSWQKRLEGMMLEKSVSASDSSNLELDPKIRFDVIHLCKDGNYHFVGLPAGKWRIQVRGLGIQLVLLATDQSTTVYSLGMAGEKVSLDGLHFKIQKSAECK